MPLQSRPIPLRIKDKINVLADEIKGSTDSVVMYRKACEIMDLIEEVW